MERVIKFRAWNPEQKVWEYNFEISPDGMVGKTNMFETYELKDWLLCQFTGLTDKNGKDIYEGDIIEIEGSKKILHVVFKKGCFYSVNNMVGTNYRLGGWEDGSFCIIGNIYENPELLSTDKTKTV